LPVAPLKAALAEVGAQAGKQMVNEAQRALRLSLAKPGNAAQRFLLKLTGLCAVLLPLAAMGWVSWLAVSAYYESALTHSGFLGVDFVANSALVVAIAWLLPFFLKLQLKPSTERAALRGLRVGINTGLAQLETRVDGVLADYAGQLEARARAGMSLLSSAQPLESLPQDALRRVIPKAEIRS
jgi:hypothetical protein